VHLLQELDQVLRQQGQSAEARPNPGVASKFSTRLSRLKELSHHVRVGQSPLFASNHYEITSPTLDCNEVPK
jgi:hypothetical protein